MARTLYSTQFLAGPGSANPYYTVPDGYVAVIRSVDFGATSADDVVALEIDDSPTGSAIAFIAVGAIPSAPGSITWTGRQVVNAGQAFGPDMGDDTYCIVSGYLLTAD